MEWRVSRNNWLMNEAGAIIFAVSRFEFDKGFLFARSMPVDLGLGWMVWGCVLSVWCVGAVGCWCAG